MSISMLLCLTASWSPSRRTRTNSPTRRGWHCRKSEAGAGWIQENDEPRQELGADGERQFFSRTADDEYSFDLHSSGRVTTMVLHTDGKALPMQRIKDTAAPAHVK